MRKHLFIFLLSSVLLSALQAQEAVKSIEEDYYNFLSLLGYAPRPYLNYRTFSDSAWIVDDETEHPWKPYLSAYIPLSDNFRMRVYGPELFMSGNTAAPYGQNDGLLWQGRGLNLMLKGGVRFEGYGFEITLLPHFVFSQNVPFDIMTSAYESEFGYIWGYRHGIGADAPQRFGDQPFFDFDFGDSEIRYTWKALTVGFGTQTIWLGPSYINSILHSNNAPAYPKFDIGLRRQQIIIPGTDVYIGDIETRLWIGHLSESDYFDSDPDNDYRMIHGFSFAYAPSFLPGLTLFANTIVTAPWDLESLRYIIPSDENTVEDRKGAFGFSWIFPEVGFEVYGELGIDDGMPFGPAGYIRHPFHTTVYTAGFKKVFPISEDNKIYGQILFEFNWMEMTKDFFFFWPYTFYFHHIIIQGYTNRGQWLGNGLGSGGNSQYIGFSIYYPKGTSTIFFQRNNPDNDFLYRNAIYDSVNNPMLAASNRHHFKANFNIGVLTSHFLTNNFLFSYNVIYNMIINPLYELTLEPHLIDGEAYFGKLQFLHNISFNLAIKYIF